ncbi:hypothetical protein GCM10007938_42340 [Vibrio zhanjiangensis]|uniref:ParB-like N-terminal domain-containing protein n=1 Tax=Vibrio zhanjiangensis TaxID=1046128 RepID=A0ABQ6F649_9VIBR|nr:ParB/RepB/Spo0J family partition protein [Vibrio zhanjiangensis]GLT20449.1 hypothetical protein GCM10007938_42340 [Vibrio zhanjiangensis]
MSRKSNLQRSNVKVDDIFNEYDETLRNSEQVVDIPKHALYSNPQVRQVFKQETIDELRVNMEKNGQRQPCRVGKMDDRGYLIQEGERRWRAIMDSDKITHVKCIIGEGDLLTQVSENILREDLNPIEEGNAYSLIKATYNFSQNKEVAEALGISESKVSAAIKAAQAPEKVQLAYLDNKIGDVDTINSLRIAYEINPDETAQFVDESQVISRKDAQELTKRLKTEKKIKASAPKDELSALVTAGAQSSPEPERSVSKTTQSPIPESGTNEKNKMKSGVRTQGIRIRLDDQLGIIDLTGQSKEGEIVVLLDNSPAKMTVPAADVEIVGYHLD